MREKGRKQQLADLSSFFVSNVTQQLVLNKLLLSSRFGFEE